MSKLIIFDTTLRDGEQSPGASMTREEKLSIAAALEQVRVDVIEAGFPVASRGDFEAVNAIAAEIQESTVCGLARAVDKDIDVAAEALKPARRARLHTFIATSPLHMREKLHLEPAAVLERAVAAVKRARQHTDDVEFSPEDAGRSDLDFLCQVVEAVIDAGARTINVPDTVGYTIPHQFGSLVGKLIERVPNSDKAIFSVHCHNDLGLAVANSLSAVLHGARQVECTINGLGERAGNAALEEVVMAVRTRQDVFDCDTGLDTTRIMHCSRLVSNITGFPVQPNKAIVGANAFAHESGIHQDGVLKHRTTYEIMRPEDVGLNANRIVLGKHSGRSALRARLQELGIYTDGSSELDAIFERFKELADKKHEVYNEDLQALASDVLQAGTEERFRLEAFVASTSTAKGDGPTATVTLNVDGQSITRTASGSGIVDAAYRAIKEMSGEDCELKLYSVSNITAGTDAQGEVTVRLDRNGRPVNGHGADTDIVIASVKAYLSALNKLPAESDTRFRMHPQAAAI